MQCVQYEQNKTNKAFEPSTVTDSTVHDDGQGVGDSGREGQGEQKRRRNQLKMKILIYIYLYYYL